MLRDLEQRFEALVAEGLASRVHLTVTRPPAPTPSPGRGVAVTSLSEVSPEAFFEPGQVALTTGPGAPRSRRVLPLRFSARVEVLVRARGQGAGPLAAARELLLDDLSQAAHALGDAGVRTGSAFETGGADPGYRVLSFQLENGTIRPDAPDRTVSGALEYRGTGEIWPPAVTREEGEIRAVDALVAPLPLEIAADDAVVPAGGSTRVRVRPPAGSRLADLAAGTRSPLRLAVAVLSDLPVGSRGTIPGGEAGADPGFRVLNAAFPETAIPYQAPAGDLGATRLEYVAVHLARPDGRTGVFLGSAAVRLVPGGP